MAEVRREADIEQTFYEAERSGLKLAIRVRTVALVLLGLFLGISRSPDPTHALELVSGVVGFVALGGIHYLIIGSRFDRKWVKYVFISVDIAILSVLVATQPLYESVNLPQAVNFRNSIFPYFFVVLGVSAFSFSPGMVLWTGIAGVIGWLSAFAWSIHDMTVRFDWTDIGPAPTNEHFISVFLNPNWIGTGSRIQESVMFMVVAILIAVVMWRARNTVRRQLELDEERQTITEVFGQFVPKAIADALITDRGALEPVERDATILFSDIAGFTEMTERHGAQKIVRVLNSYFDGVTRIISEYDGVITQFQGDAILATFNVPLEDPEHAVKAVRAARDIQALVREKKFDGTEIRARVGVCTGPVLAGNIGGGGRQNYTVHGDTVNLAARLEALNKEHGTDVLVSDRIVQLVGGNVSGIGFDRIGEIDVRGLSQPVSIYTFA